MIQSLYEVGEPSRVTDIVIGLMLTTLRRLPRSPVTQTFDPQSIIWLIVAVTLRIVMDKRMSPWIPQTLVEHTMWVMLLVIDGSGGRSARVESRL
jgi:hypothetical protein